MEVLLAQVSCGYMQVYTSLHRNRTIKIEISSSRITFELTLYSQKKEYKDSVTLDVFCLASHKTPFKQGVELCVEMVNTIARTIRGG